MICPMSASSANEMGGYISCSAECAWYVEKNTKKGAFGFCAIALLAKKGSGECRTYWLNGEKVVE